MKLTLVRVYQNVDLINLRLKPQYTVFNVSCGWHRWTATSKTSGKSLYQIEGLLLKHVVDTPKFVQ